MRLGAEPEENRTSNYQALAEIKSLPLIYAYLKSPLEDFLDEMYIPYTGFIRNCE